MPGFFSIVLCIRHIEGPPWLGSCSVVWVHQSLKGARWVGSYSLVYHAFDGPASLSIVQLPALASGEREAMVMAPPLRDDSAVSPFSMAAWLSSTGVSHHDLLPHIPSICLSTVNSSPRPGIAPQSLNSSSQLLRLPGDQYSCPGYV